MQTIAKPGFVDPESTFHGKGNAESEFFMEAEVVVSTFKRDCVI